MKSNQKLFKYVYAQEDENELQNISSRHGYGVYKRG
jgi:hypothetical protein